MFNPGITSPYGPENTKRWLSPTSSTPPGWISPGPPCTITNANGQVVSAFVQINGVQRGYRNEEDWNSSFMPVNGGTNYPNGPQSDSTFNIFTPGYFTPGYGPCYSGNTTGCMHSVHVEIDHDWKGASYCGPSTACDNNTLVAQTTAYQTKLDVQGFVFWDQDHLNESTHNFSGWELHPLTAWRISTTPPPLSAGFTFSPSSPRKNQQVTFTGSASGGTTPYSFSWTFGDGSSGTGSTVTHAYASTGTFTVVLTVKDNGLPQQTATSQQSVTVTSQPTPLTASFTYSPSAPIAGQQVTFTASASGGTAPYSFSWNFGDGSTGTGYSISHTYVTAGTFTVALTVKDSGSPQQTTSSQQSITVTNPPPPTLTASFTFTPANPQVGQTVSFTGSASGGTQPYTYSWTFGDSGTGSGSSVTHTYQAAGNYTVVLTVTDAAGKTASSTQTVTVSNPPPPTLTASFTYNPASPLV